MRKNLTKIFAIALTTFISAGCSDSGREVKSSEFGEQWPFTVDSGRVDCAQGVAAIFIANGEEYQLTGQASSMGYQPIDPIWRDNPEIAGLKVSLSEVTKLALEQC